MDTKMSESIQFLAEGKGEDKPVYGHLREKIAHLLEEKGVSLAQIAKASPLFSVSEDKEFPFLLTISLLSVYRYDISSFFQDMVSKWLIPGFRIAFESLTTVRIRSPSEEGAPLQFMEGVISARNERDLYLIQNHLGLLQNEIELGLRSFYHAKQILEVKGLSNDEKLSLMQDEVTKLVHRFPAIFDYDIFALLQRFFLSTSDEYKKARSYRDLFRIVYISYGFMQKLLDEKEENQEIRHLYLKVKQVKMHTPLGVKEALGIHVGLNFLKDNELFEKRHLLKALLKCMPESKEVVGSYFSQSRGEEQMKTLYIEIEKQNGMSFTFSEIRFLQVQLKIHLLECIESMIRPLFMPRNEEEVMKYIVTLASQIKMPRDIPQIVIMFDEQTDQDLLFTVIMVRALLPNFRSLEELFLEDEGVEVGIEKVKVVGAIRKKIPKEASIMRFRLSNAAFLRDDFAVDLYKARQKLVRILKEKLGDVRDYNGGMISRQMERFFSFKELLHGFGESNEYLLENFFHSLYPIELRVITDLACLKTLYFMFQKLCFQTTFTIAYETAVEERCVYFCAKLYEHEIKKNLLEGVNKMHLPNTQALKFILPVQGATYIGFIFFTDSNLQQNIFLEALRNLLA